MTSPSSDWPSRFKEAIPSLYIWARNELKKTGPIGAFLRKLLDFFYGLVIISAFVFIVSSLTGFAIFEFFMITYIIIVLTMVLLAVIKCGFNINPLNIPQLYVRASLVFIIFVLILTVVSIYLDLRGSAHAISFRISWPVFSLSGNPAFVLSQTSPRTTELIVTSSDQLALFFGSPDIVAFQIINKNWLNELISSRTNITRWLLESLTATQHLTLGRVDGDDALKLPDLPDNSELVIIAREIVLAGRPIVLGRTSLTLIAETVRFERGAGLVGYERPPGHSQANGDHTPGRHGRPSGNLRLVLIDRGLQPAEQNTKLVVDLRGEDGQNGGRGRDAPPFEPPSPPATSSASQPAATNRQDTEDQMGRLLILDLRTPASARAAEQLLTERLASFEQNRPETSDLTAFTLVQNAVRRCAQPDTNREDCGLIRLCERPPTPGEPGRDGRPGFAGYRGGDAGASGRLTIIATARVFPSVSQVEEVIDFTREAPKPGTGGMGGNAQPASEGDPERPETVSPCGPRLRGQKGRDPPQAPKGADGDPSNAPAGPHLFRFAERNQWLSSLR